MADHLTYQGNRTDFDPKLVLGSDIHGAYYAIKSMDYDAETDVTTATMRIVLPAELNQRIGEPVDALTKLARVYDLFNKAPEQPEPVKQVGPAEVAACTTCYPPVPTVCLYCEKDFGAAWLLKYHQRGEQVCAKARTR